MGRVLQGVATEFRHQVHSMVVLHAAPTNISFICLVQCLKQATISGAGAGAGSYEAAMEPPKSMRAAERCPWEMRSCTCCFRSLASAGLATPAQRNPFSRKLNTTHNSNTFLTGGGRSRPSIEPCRRPCIDQGRVALLTFGTQACRH